MRTHNQRGYVHTKYGAVLLWHRSLQCWILNRIQPNGKIQQSLYGFRNSKAEAITALRAEHKMRIPQAGWDGIQIKHKGLTEWNQLVQMAWAQNQKA